MSDERVRLVKQANDIVDVVGSYLTLRPAGGTFKGLCPFHDDSRPSFDVDPRRQRYRCWACGKFGDVISFVQEFEKLPFREALESLARRKNIDLGPEAAAQSAARAKMIDVMRWAAKQYQECLLECPVEAPEYEAVAAARRYVGVRGLVGETVRKWGLGFAPNLGDWLIRRAEDAGISFDLLESVGLIAQRSDGHGWYDRFRDRVQFPIRDVRGQVVAFGGRILPGSPLVDRVPKYYNSSDTPLFSKSENLYGIDLARDPAHKAGHLAIVEGYTDVLMAHQHGVCNVVATMGTALNDRHVRQLKRFVPRVVLVFDADEGGDKGVDRALELFASQEMELAVATLPAGLDPCDLLVKEGPGPFKRALEAATDALEYKLQRALGQEDESIEGRRRVVDSVLGVLALVPPAHGGASAVKMQLMVGRIARRLGLGEDALWSRLDELRRARRGREQAQPAPAARSAKAAPEERDLLQVLLAEPGMVARAEAEIRSEEIRHEGLRRLLEGLYALHRSGQTPSLDLLRQGMENGPLLTKAFELQEVGEAHNDRAAWLSSLLAHFRSRRQESARRELKDRLQGVEDRSGYLELLAQIQARTDDSAAKGSQEPVAVGP
ncbi:MAG: DNA primase [Gemmataceae bacterium]|nr:DNA primase [Gemmataceae bacterium]